MLPLSMLPFAFYFANTGEGQLLWAKVETTVTPPQVPPLDDADRAWAWENRPSYEGRVAVLVYHGLGPSGDETGLTISPDRFAEQMATLKAAGMQTVTARDMALAFAGLKRLPPNAVLVTFDDGRLDALLYADPILEQLEMQATMFVITRAASERGIYYAEWKKLGEYAASGRWDLQSHTADLHRLQEVEDGRSLPALTSLAPDEDLDAYRTRIQTDLAEAQETIEQETGTAPVAFAYPFGAYGYEHDDRVNHPRVGELVRDAVGRTNLLAFHQTDQDKWGLATCSQDPLGIRRLTVDDWPGKILLARIAEAAGEEPEGPDCTDTYFSGEAIDALDEAPAPVRSAVEAVASSDPEAGPRNEEAARAASALAVLAPARSDALTGCQVMYVDCLTYVTAEPDLWGGVPWPTATSVGGPIRFSAAAPMQQPHAVTAPAPSRTKQPAPQPPPYNGSVQPPPSGSNRTPPPSSGGGDQPSSPPSSGPPSNDPPSGGPGDNGNKGKGPGGNGPPGQGKK